jgi:hypothetical protein
MASGCDGSSEVARVGAGSTVRRGLGSSGRGADRSARCWCRWSEGQSVEDGQGLQRERGERGGDGQVQQPAAAGAGRGGPERRGIFARPRSRRTNRCVRTAGVPGRRLRLARRRQTEGLQRPELPTKGAAPVLAARRTMPQRLRCLRVTIRFVVGSVLVGLACGRPERPNDGAIAFRLCQTAPPDG